MEIKNEWLATIICALNDSIKFNDTLRNSETVTDIEDIEEWMMQLFECKEYLREEIAKNPELIEKLEKHFKI